jgi:signal transduction histidine kinase
VAWLVELSALRTLVDDHAGDATGGPGASLAEARRRVHALVAQTRREGVTRATVGALAALDQGLQASAPGLGPAEAAEREGRLLASFDAAVSALRAENRDISIELGEHWTHINALALAAVLMAGLILALLWVVWRRRDHERQLSAELLRSNADKDLFLAVLSHDIRTPMTAILGSAELLSGQPTPDRASRHAALVRNAGGTVVRLIDDVLALSRSQAGGLSLAAAPVDLRVLLRESVALFQPAAEARGVELAWEVAEEVPGVGAGRCHSAAPDRDQPPGERDEVHRRGHGQGRAGRLGVRRRRALRVRHRARHRPRLAGPGVSALQSGRRRHHGPARRLRAGSGDRPQPRAGDGRRGQRRVAARRRHDVSLQAAAPRDRAPPRSKGCFDAPAVISWTYGFALVGGGALRLGGRGV